MKGGNSHIVEAALGIETGERSLTARKAGNRLAVARACFLSLVTARTRATTAGRRTTTKSLALCNQSHTPSDEPRASEERARLSGRYLRSWWAGRAEGCRDECCPMQARRTCGTRRACCSSVVPTGPAEGQRGGRKALEWRCANPRRVRVSRTSEQVKQPT